MLIEIENYYGGTLGSIEVDGEIENVKGNISLADIEEVENQDIVRIQLEDELTPFQSLNHESCVSPMEQELGAYKALKKYYLDKNYNDCSIIIKYYLGHVNYGLEFGYGKSHGEICLILYHNLLYSIQEDNDDFIKFVDNMIHKIEWKIENK